jgi:hypothetical protein
MDNVIIAKFKKKIKKNGQTMKWFFEDRIRRKTGLSYGGFSAQLNGYASLSEPVKAELMDYNRE